MNPDRCGAVLLLVLLTLATGGHPQSVLRIVPENRIAYAGNRKIAGDDTVYCESWKYTVETNDAGKWSTVPERCVEYVKYYMTGDRYLSDTEVVSDASLVFAKNVSVLQGDAKNAWVFDIDETLLSNLPYYEVHGFGSEQFDENSFNEWVDLAEAPAITASLNLYGELQGLGFKIFLLTGRSEDQRNVTEKNLLYAGYRSWEKLILREDSDEGKLAVVYKSEKRKELEAEGYRILGSSGDQWSDLLGFATAIRSFKLPNPMYYIP